MKTSQNTHVLKPNHKNMWKQLKRDKLLYLLLAPAVISVLFFQYLPLPGLLIAFKEYDIFLGFNSPWVGLANIYNIFNLPMFQKAIFNTIKVSVLSLSICFPAPIIFALLLNELKNGLFKRTVQTISYLPHFLSWISVVGMVYSFYSKYGLANDILISIFGPNTTRELFLTKQALFIPNIIVLDVWKSLGWSSIIYLAALSSVDLSLYEAAYIDGAGKFKQMLHVTLPSIAPTIIIMLLFRLSSIFQSNFELIYGLQNSFIDYEVISTIVYKYGITRGEYSMATAFGFMEGAVSLILVIIVNKISKKVMQTSIL